MNKKLSAVALLGLIAAPVISQSNATPGMDIALTDASNLRSYGRIGSFPNGTNGLAMSVSVCNEGTVLIPWNAAMQPVHPFYGFIVCRENNGRFEQISDWSYLKHGFLSINGGGCSSSCINPGSGSLLGFYCSDVYGSSLNADRYYLGPPSEIDPWLGTWDPFGSHFDLGEPSNGMPNGSRSLTRTQVRAMNGVTHRIEVADADLNVPGARYFYGGQVKIGQEPEANRVNNFVTREFRPTWTGSSWSISTISAGQNDTILHRWPGATITSATNGSEDGRFNVGLIVTGPVNGMWHYEYTVENRDNSRAGASLRIPICSTARVENLSFRDIDGDLLNEWTTSVTGGEIAFLAPPGNALEWATIYNFSFDSDAGPVNGQLTIDQARIMGLTNLSVTVPAQVPGFLANEYLGDGCGSPAPALWATGSPANGSIPNASFGVRVSAQPNAGLFVFYSLGGASANLGGSCVRYLDETLMGTWGFAMADPAGTLDISLPIPNNPAIEGLDVYWQAGEIATGGPLFGMFNLTNGLRVRVGNNITGCP